MSPVRRAHARLAMRLRPQIPGDSARREHGRGRRQLRTQPNVDRVRDLDEIPWPADEYIFVKLTAEGTFDAFYAEAGKLLAETLNARHGSLPTDVIDEAVQLNHALVNQPFATGNLTLKLRHDLLGYWHAVRNGEQALLREAPVLVEIDRLGKRYDDFQKWCREIVWWGNKKGAYLYSPIAKEITPELAGHY
jgi:hypothetical protein